MHRQTLIVGAAGAAAFVAWALWRGQDANWDWQNYHDYAAYALLHGRYRLDVAPGGFQGYLNPLIELPSYELRHRLSPPLAASVLAAMQSSFVLALWGVAGRLIPGRPFARAIATLAGVCSATAVSEIGTSISDLLLAGLDLGALLLLLGEGRPRALLLAGALAGVATGLKLTNAVFVAGLLAVLLVQWRPRGTWFGAGLAYGGLIAGGPWAAYMAWQYDNPIFPGLNNLFHSASAARIEFSDGRFLPHGVLDALGYPLRIALGQHPTGELAFADPRLALALPLAVAWIAWGLWRGRRFARSAADRALLHACVFLCVSTAVWLWLFAIERYIVTLEALAGALVVALVARCVPGRAAVGVAAILLIAATRPTDWWRRPWSDAFVPRPPPALTTPAAIVMVDQPLGYWVSALPAASRFYQLNSLPVATGGVLARRMAQGVAHPPPGGVWVLGLDQPMSPAVRARLGALDLAPAAPCHRARSIVFVDAIACRAVPGPAHDGVPALAPGEPVDFAATGAGWMFEDGAWSAAGRDGARVQPPGGDLVLRPAMSGVLDMRLHDAVAWRVRSVCVAAGGVVREDLPVGTLLGSMTLRAAACPQR